MCLNSYEKSSLGKETIVVPDLKLLLTTSHDTDLETNFRVSSQTNFEHQKPHPAH